MNEKHLLSPFNYANASLSFGLWFNIAHKLKTKNRPIAEAWIKKRPVVDEIRLTLQEFMFLCNK